MANQSPDRRQVLQMLGVAAAAAQFPGFSRWCFGAEAQAFSAAADKPPYTPQFFTPEEYAAIDTLTEIIIPHDDTPGARDAGVAEFIDFMTAHDDEIQQPFQSGLKWLNAKSRNQYGQHFSALPASDQETILRRLAYRSEQSAEDLQGQQFFDLLRRYTVMGYYTTRIGLEQLDFPGLRMYSSSPACTHKDDPEHRNVRPAY
jgi:hypothetical protein